MTQNYEEFEDRVRLEKVNTAKKNQYSRYCDFIYYHSSINPELTLAMRVLKPERPSYILAGTHGWHMTIPAFQEYDTPQSEYLKIQVDMRGRSFSDGTPDCNGLELIDIIDAVEYVKKHYSEYILDKDVVYYEGGSGAGGNGLAIAAKFPDYFAHYVNLYGPSDFIMFYKDDKIGEFRDEMSIWIGDVANETAYAARSGLHLLKNLCAPMVLIHGENDIRVPIAHAERYMARAKELSKDALISYIRLKGVGGYDHLDNITEADQLAFQQFYEEDRRKYKAPVQIPRNGHFKIGGYLFTKHFSVMLDSMDKMAEITYDLDQNEFHVSGVTENEYTLTIY